MIQKDTIEVDPSELSDEVREELISDADISQEEAEDLADKSKLKQMNFTDPNKTNIIELTRRKVEKGVGRLRSAYRSLSERNALPVISDVSTDDNSVVLQTEHPKLDDQKIRLTRDDKEIANLMAYYKVDNPINLKGKKLVIKDIDSFLQSDTSEVELLVPHNVSFLGRVRYKLFSLVQDVRSKTNIQNKDDTDWVVITIAVLFSLSLLALPVGFLTQFGLVPQIFLILYFSLIILIGISSLTVLTFQFILLLLSLILKGNFHKI